MIKRFLWHLLGVVIFLTVISVGFSLGYFIAGKMYHVFSFHTSDYLFSLVAIAIGFFVMAFMGFFLHLIFGPNQRKIYQEIVDALKRIAKGDFNVYLDFKINKRSEFFSLINHINHMAKQLKQMEEMRQEFISNVSHEIQSPLTSIMGFARALQYDEPTNEERSHYLSIIETESRRLSKLSDNLLKLTSLESEQHPFDRKGYQLDQQIRTIILACEPNWMAKELEMDISLDKVTILADEDLMSQVWINLIHNGIKFTPNHGEIQIQLKQIDDMAMIKISDTGMGISKKDQVHIFERFYKADQARERSKDGNGLGLSIVKKIIDLHNGTIHVESEIGKGTTFTIKLPTTYHQ